MEWLTWVHEPQGEKELGALRNAIVKGRPFGDEKWRASTTGLLGLQSSHRRTGRPSKSSGRG